MLNHLPPTILIIESDIVLRTNISNSLERQGLNVLAFSDGSEAMKAIDRLPQYHKPSVIVVRDHLEPMNGIEICTIVKTKSSLKDTSVIMISDSIKKILEVKDLENSFDDFILKPFSQSDLVQKIKSILGKKKPSLASRTLTYKNIKMDLASYKVKVSGREVHLGPTEFKILQCLIENPKKTFSREDIMKYAWETNQNVEMRTIDVHVNRLRSALKLPHDPNSTHYIKTIRSAGYCLDQEK